MRRQEKSSKHFERTTMMIVVCKKKISLEINSKVFKLKQTHTNQKTR